ncbi:hypothetical protein ADUPG1_004084, partial [Aduncisulcus paluster]
SAHASKSQTAQVLTRFSERIPMKYLRDTVKGCIIAGDQCSEILRCSIEALQEHETFRYSDRSKPYESTDKSNPQGGRRSQRRDKRDSKPFQQRQRSGN